MEFCKERALRTAAMYIELYAEDRKKLADKRAEWRKKQGLPPVKPKRLLGVFREEDMSSNAQYNKVWKKANPDAKRIENHNYKSKKRATGKLSKDIVERLMALQKGKCACCGKMLGKNYHVDHIVPVSRGGKNIDENVQLLTARCNIQKSNKDPIDFMQERGFLL